MYKGDDKTGQPLNTKNLAETQGSGFTLWWKMILGTYMCAPNYLLVSRKSLIKDQCLHSTRLITTCVVEKGQLWSGLPFSQLSCPLKNRQGNCVLTLLKKSNIYPGQDRRFILGFLNRQESWPKGSHDNFNTTTINTTPFNNYN